MSAYFKKYLRLIIIILIFFESLTYAQEGSIPRCIFTGSISDPDPQSIDNFKEVDARAMNAPESVETSTELLAAYLTEDARTDRQKARAIYRWIAENIEYDVKGLFKGDRVDSTAEGVLKSRSSLCGGYSNLYERLANLSGLEAVTISGYSKGYGYSPGMHFTEPADHAWNAVKIEGKWHLIDSTWGAGKVDKDGKYNKEFDDYYFLTSPEKFIFDHLPEDPHWQLLDEPISKEEFEDLVCLEPAFFDLGIRLGNQENVSIISNGKANITLYPPEDVSLIAELEMPADLALSRKIHGSPTFISRSKEQCSIELLPPFPGEYILRVFGRCDSDGADEFEMIMECQVIELSGSKRSFPEISSDFQQLNAYLLAPLTGEIEAGSNLTFQVRIPEVKEVVVISGDRWNYLTGNEDIFQGNVIIEKGDVDVAVKRPGMRSFRTIIRYRAI